ncbi:MAG: alpha-amylase family glycosyl hydrolase [Prochloraceae cyanobacterium]
MTVLTEKSVHFSLRVEPLLQKIYEPEIAEQLTTRLFSLLREHFADSVHENLDKWSEDNVLLITYGDSIYSNQEEKPLHTLSRFLEKYLQDTITGVHILPFFPYSSDDGFAVIDYCRVNPELGDWSNIKTIARKFDLMIDLVINHASSKSIWFEQFKQGKKPGCDYFIELEPSEELSQVVRPRSSPLLAKVNTVNGEKHVWATFSHDQIDLNFSNPDVLLEFIRIILLYVQMGAKYVRLDAIAYLWKSLGTSCIHLDETHIVIKLLREILQMVDSDVALITETNVPNGENIKYFGNRDEAHMIYNFSLPPLLLNALMQGKAERLQTWMMRMPPAPIGCTYLNFTASHDGIGLRPAEGLLYEDEYQILLQRMQEFGGKISMRKKPDGTESPYEINISWFDAMKGTAKGEDKWQIERFICSQTVMMSLEAIPAFYIHNLLATPNDPENVERTGNNRAINRSQLNYEELERQLRDAQSPKSIVLQEMCRRIKIRRRQKAFHPNSIQYTLQTMNKALFAFWRQSITRDQSIFCINNLSDQPQQLDLSYLNLVIIDPWYDLISGQFIEDLYSILTLEPYQSVWITNKF